MYSGRAACTSVLKYAGWYIHILLCVIYGQRNADGAYFLRNGSVCPLMAILGVVALCNAFHFTPLLCSGGISAL